MKYYLIIGYRTQEKHKEFGKIQVFANGKLIDDFVADNESSFTQKKILPLGYAKQDHKKPTYSAVNFRLQLHDPDRNLPGQLQFDCPTKFKIIELDDGVLEKTSNLQIKIIGGPTNYANGFVTKTNTIQIFPVFLFPKDLLHDQYLIDEIFKRHYRYSWKKQDEIDVSLYDFQLGIGNFPHDLIKYRDGQIETVMSGDINDPAHNDLCEEYSADIQWPGPNFINLKKNGKTHHTWIGNPRGGEYSLEYYVHKKYNMYFLHTSSQIKKPRILLNMIWYSLIEKLQKAIEQKP